MAWTPPKTDVFSFIYIGHPKGYNKKMRGGEDAGFLGGSVGQFFGFFGSLVSLTSFCSEFSLKYWDFHDPI